MFGEQLVPQVQFWDAQATVDQLQFGNYFGMTSLVAAGARMDAHLALRVLSTSGNEGGEDARGMYLLATLWLGCLEADGDFFARNSCLAQGATTLGW